jgi:hypothetical protein
MRWLALLSFALLAGCFDGPPFPPGEALPAPSFTPRPPETDDAIPAPSPEATDTPVPVTVTSVDKTVDGSIVQSSEGQVTVYLSKTSTSPAVVTLTTLENYSSIVECEPIDIDPNDLDSPMDCESLLSANPLKISMAVSPTIVQFVGGTHK